MKLLDDDPIDSPSSPEQCRKLMPFYVVTYGHVFIAGMALDDGAPPSHGQDSREMSPIDSESERVFDLIANNLLTEDTVLPPHWQNGQPTQPGE